MFLGYVHLPGLTLAAAAGGPFVVLSCAPTATATPSRPVHSILVFGGFRATSVPLSAIIIFGIIIIVADASHPILLPVLFLVVVVKVILPGGCPAGGTRPGTGTGAGTGLGP